MKTDTNPLNPAGTTQLPCGCIVRVKQGELGKCTGAGSCKGDPR
jgi:hypothetical protein